MSLLRHRYGLVVFPHHKGIVYFWQTPAPSARDIFAAKSHDGERFHSTIDLIAYFKRDGSKGNLGPNPLVRANTFSSPLYLFVSEKGKPGSLVTLKKNLSWKIIAQSELLSGPTVCLELPATKKQKIQYLAFSARQGRSIFLARSSGSWSRFREEAVIVRARPKQFDARELAPLYTALIGKEILLVYSAVSQTGVPAIGAVLVSREDPSEVIWRSDFPLWQPPHQKHYSTLRFLGGFPHGKYFSLYIESPEYGLEYFPMAEYWLAPRHIPLPPIALPKRITGVKIILDRALTNPILEPRTAYAWDAFATFNPAALLLENRIYLLYRAQGYNGQSVLGYASSGNGVRIDERSNEPVFVPPLFNDATDTLYPIASGGGTGGCEDPRLVEIDGIIYLMYVAFDGVHPPGVALSQMSVKNFLAKHWQWSKPRLISRPGQIQKNWVLFPKKIGGKFAILHGLTPSIKIEYFDTLDELGKTQYMESLSSHGGRGYIDTERLAAWDNIVRGAGAPPLLTKEGWLVFYHGMDMRDPGKYKVGVLLLDRDQPEIILRRALEPILEPETLYENYGHKRGVVYVCGAVIKEKTLFVYYGASDRSTAVATTNIDTFLSDLMKEKAPTLQKMNISKHS